MHYSRRYFRHSLLVVLAIALTGCSNSISSHIKSNISAYDNGTVIVEPDAAIFIFKPEPRPEWKWYQKSTPLNQQEYNFGVQFELDGVAYKCGYSLFKHPLARPDAGSFKELISAGQVDLWKMETSPGVSFGERRVLVGISGRQVNYVRMRTVVDDHFLAIILKEKDIVEQFNKSRPDSILFTQSLPSEKTQRKPVKVTYRDMVASDK